MNKHRNTHTLAAAATALWLFGSAQGALGACAGGPDLFTCRNETDFLAKAGSLGYTTFQEGFEDDTVWGTVRSSPSVIRSAPSITAQGIVWTANHPQNEITTGAGAKRTGLWGIYDPDHGFATGTTAECDVDLPPEHCLFYDGVTGTRVTGESPLYAVGGYIKTTTIGANIQVLLDDVRQIDFGKPANTAYHFLGVIDRRGFNRFQVREADGKIGQKFLIFADDFTFGLIPPAVWPALTPATVNSNWTPIDAATGYLSPVVIAGPPTFHGADPGVVRLRNVTPLGFEMRFQEWDYRLRVLGDAAHGNEDVPYVVLESGRHLMPDGSIWEVGRFDLGGTKAWKRITFTQPFTKTPHLFLTVQTENDPSAISVRARKVALDGFDAALLEEEALNNGHGIETVGYLAITSPSGNGWIDTSHGTAPYLLQSVNGDHRWIPLLSQRIKVEEEKSADVEVTHADEALRFLALGSQILAQQVSNIEADTTALRRLEPTADAPMEWGILRGLNNRFRVLPFAKTYTAPVLVAKPSSDLGADPGVIRLTGLQGDQAQVRYQEWDYLDGTHSPAEEVFYVVSEAGQYSLGGLQIEAGSLSTGKIARRGQWAQVPLVSPFAQTPVLLSAVMTTTGRAAVTTRIQDPTATSFFIAMDEQELSLDGHSQETLGWIAIAPGSGTTKDRRKVQTFVAPVGSPSTSVPYTGIFHRYPTIVGDVDSFFEPDPVSLRFSGPTNNRVGLRLAEEQSLDIETSHLQEDIGLFVAE